MIAPRSCYVCGEGRIEGCFECTSKLGHHHLTVLDRTGTPVGTVAACDVHGPPTGTVPLADVQHGTQAISELASPSLEPDLHRRWLDRTYRQATRQLRENHRTEFDTLLHQARHDSPPP